MLYLENIIKVKFFLKALGFFKSRANEFNSRTEGFIPRHISFLFSPAQFSHSSHILIILRSTALHLYCLYRSIVSGFETLSFGVARPSPKEVLGSGQATHDLDLVPWESTRRLRPTVHNTVSVETATLEVGITPLTPVPSKLSGLPWWSNPRGKAFNLIPAGYPLGLETGKAPLLLWLRGTQ